MHPVAWLLLSLVFISLAIVVGPLTGFVGVALSFLCGFGFGYCGVNAFMKPWSVNDNH